MARWRNRATFGRRVIGMIKKIHIERFRCFDNFFIEDLSPITIIGGKNNCGKTTLLESLIVPLSGNHPSVFWNLLSMRNVNADKMSPSQMWNPLFHDFENTDEFSIKIFLDSPEEINFVAQKKFNGIVERGKEKIFSSSTEKNFSSLKVTLETGKYSIEGQYNLPSVISPTSGKMEFIPGPGADAVPLPYGAITLYRTVTTGASVAELVSKIGLDKHKKNLLVSAMRIFDPHIEDINAVLDNGSPYVYVTLNSGRHFPINYMGDGINKAVEILVHILNLQNGTLLIDEAENGFHYGVYVKLLKIFFETALTVQCQIITTSHSREFIESVLEATKEIDRLKELSYHRLGFSKGMIRAFSFPGDALSDAFETNMEVR